MTSSQMTLKLAPFGTDPKHAIFTLVSLILISGVVSAEPVKWPEPIAEKVRQIEAVKKEAMSYPNMRTPEGRLGKRFEALTEELGTMVKEPALIEQVERRAQEEIDAKIVQWALDRKKRSQEYRRFARYYVDRPDYKDLQEYLDRPKKKITSQADPFAKVDGVRLAPAKPSDANPVDVEDRVETNRLILEYCYYAPPSGEAFGEDIHRHNLIGAIYSLGHLEKSWIVMANDAEFALTFDPSGHVRWDKDRLNLPIGFLIRCPSERSFLQLAKFWKMKEADERIGNMYGMIWSRELAMGYFLQNSPISQNQDPARANYDAWQSLAKTKREDSVEGKGFADWLLEQKPPVDGSAK